MTEMTYVLGHDAPEVHRLQLQAKCLEPVTSRLFREAGLAPGMSVLDVGAGAGDVSMLAAALVGSSGRVLGVDTAASVLDVARERAASLGFSNLAFRAVSPQGGDITERFDFVVGRLVAVHQSDRAGFLRSMAARVRPGGTLALIEPAYKLEDGWSEPEVPEHDEMMRWVLGAFQSAGATSVGFHFVDLFAQAGLSEPQLFCDIPMGGPASPIIEWMYLSLQTLMPQLERAGIATAAEVGLDTLVERTRRAAVSKNAQLRVWAMVAAWTRVH